MMLSGSALEMLLQIRIDPSVFAPLDFGQGVDVFERPQEFFERARYRHGDVIPVDGGSIDGVRLPFLAGRDQGPVFVATGFDSVQQVLLRAEEYHQFYAESMDLLMGENQLAGLNPPRHRRYRGLIAQAFGRRAMREATDSLVRPLADALVASLPDRQPLDLFAELCCRLPVFVIGELFGLPRARYPEFASEAARLMANLVDWPGALEASARLKTMLRALIDERRTQPGSDLISHLVTAQLDGDGLSDDDVIAFCRALIPAGIETTVRSLGTFVAALLSHREQWALLQREPERIDQAVAEVLRWNGPAQMLPKRTTRSVTLGGRRLPAGARVWAHIGAANRDPERWPDPHRFDITRLPRPHLAFSQGPHLCIGHQLARSELKSLVLALLRYRPDLRLHTKVGGVPILGVIMRSPAAVPVEPGPEARR